MKRLLLLLSSTVLLAQVHPEGTSAILYFAQFADGGARTGQQWQTTFTFTNLAFPESGAYVTLELFDNSGQPLSIDFGNGLSSTHDFYIPARGLRVLKSRISSPNIVVGWARARSSFPVQGTVAFRQFEQGRPVTEISAHSTQPTYTYASQATRQLGIAIANTSSYSSAQVSVSVRDQNGASVTSRSLAVAPLAHLSFTLDSFAAGLASDFAGTVTLESKQPFIAWTLYGDGAVISSLPSGRHVWPISHWERIWTAFQKVLAVARSSFPDAFVRPVELRISDAQQVNAFASSDGNSIQINLALAELLGDSDSELAFCIAHELGHTWQFRNGRAPSELEADAFGTLVTLAAGYDPYAAAGAFGKMQMAAGSPGLLGEIVRDLVDPHRSFSTRIDSVMSTMSVTCSYSPELRTLCTEFKSLVHPHFPATLPLRVGPRDGDR